MKASTLWQKQSQTSVLRCLQQSTLLSNFIGKLFTIKYLFDTNKVKLHRSIRKCKKVVGCIEKDLLIFVLGTESYSLLKFALFAYSPRKSCFHGKCAMKTYLQIHFLVKLCMCLNLVYNCSNLRGMVYEILDEYIFGPVIF